MSNSVTRAFSFFRANKKSVLALIVALALILLANLGVRWRYSAEEDRMMRVYGVPIPYRIVFNEAGWGHPCLLLDDSPLVPFCFGALICDVLAGLLALLGFWTLLFRVARRPAIRRWFSRPILAGAGGVLVLGGVFGFFFERGAYQEQRAILAEIRHTDEDSFIWTEYPGPDAVWSLVRSLASRWYPGDDVANFLDAAVGTVVRIQGSSRVAQFVPKLPGLKFMAIDYVGLGDGPSGAIPHLVSPTLARVELELDDWRDVTNILDLPRLRFLTIRGDPGAEFLSRIHRIKSLEVLDMDGSMSLTEGFVRFREFPKLRAVSFFNDSVTVKTLRDISGMKHLEGLDVSSGMIGDEEIKELRDLPSLKTLVLQGCQIGDEGLKSVAGLRELRYLDLSRGLSPKPITDAGLALVASLRHLEQLSLGGTVVTDKGMAMLSTLPNLRTLDIGKSGAPAAGLTRLAGCHALSTLVLDSTAIDSSAGAVLSRMKGLESLDVTHTNFGDAGVASIQSLDALQTLKLSWTPVTDECFLYLRRMKALREVWLDGTSVTPAGVVRMKDVPSLRMLFLYNCPRITADALLKLQQLMPKVDIMHPVICTGPAPVPKGAIPGTHN